MLDTYVNNNECNDKNILFSVFVCSTCLANLFRINYLMKLLTFVSLLLKENRK